MERPDVHFQARSVVNNTEITLLSLRHYHFNCRTEITWKLHKNSNQLTARYPNHSANKTKLTPAVVLCSPPVSPDPFQGRHQKPAFVIPGSAGNSGLLLTKVRPMCKQVREKLNATSRLHFVLFDNRCTWAADRNWKKGSTTKPWIWTSGISEQEDNGEEIFL